ncbi:DsbA family protein [Arthrobacter sp. Sr24]
MSSKNEPRLNKAERTSQAREQAKIIRDAQLKKEKRNGWLIRGGVLAAAVAIIVIIALIVINTQKANEPIASTGPVPASMNAFGGVTLGKGGEVVPPETPAADVDMEQLPPAPTAPPAEIADPAALGIKASASGEPAQMVIYVDFMCPACKGFEEANGAQIDELREAGEITVDYRALNYLDRFAMGTNYSSRSAAAAACVADVSPDKYKAYFDSLFTNAPEENSKGLNNAKLVSLATEVGAADISSCVDSKTYRPMVAYSSALASTSGVNATPTVFLEGQQWKEGQFPAFVQGILDAKK